ncbi:MULTISPECIES: chemotaxis protein CheC [Clostridium]|uniref:Chemotaxis protein CheC n=1 Tax=Clostridium paridis TaxID=2803863 RepID=A0A937K5D6_9CLOT|nr:MULTISPECIES: chemotaxis protein CheC [Clostridium]MBL4932894.1 chemotaxis protein CheC [Clostridium paridis]
MKENLFSPMQLDAIREVSNIGAGNAATALSQLLNKKIDMSVPSVNIIDFEEVFSNFTDEKEVLGILIRVLGDTPGNILFIFEKDAASEIVEALIGSADMLLTEMGKSALCEVGNIISGAFMNAISKFTNLSIMASVPAMSHDMLGAVLSSTMIETAQFSENILEIETNFLTGNNCTEAGGYFYFLPMPGSLEKILNAIGVM